MSTDQPQGFASEEIRDQQAANTAVAATEGEAPVAGAEAPEPQSYEQQLEQGYIGRKVDPVPNEDYQAGGRLTQPGGSLENETVAE